jgi:hypothetical protein
MIKKCQNVEAKTSTFVHFSCFYVNLSPLLAMNWLEIKVLCTEIVHFIAFKAVELA